MPWTVPIEWLEKELEKEAVLAELDQSIQSYEEALNRFWNKNIPEKAGGQLAWWKAFRSNIQEEDVLWWFSSPKKTWDQAMGWAGFAIIREGQLVDAIVTRQG